MIFKKLKQLLSSRGPLGLTRFILSRVLRVTHENIYHKECSVKQCNVQISETTQNWKVHKINRNNFNKKNNSALLESISHGEIETYINGIKVDSILFAVTDEKKVIHTSFVQFKSRYKKLIQELHEIPLIGNCWTDIQYRGQGLYPKTINIVAESLFQEGYDRVLISCAVDNIASIKGIEKAQFKLDKQIKSYIFLNKFAWQYSTKDNVNKLSVITF